MDCRFRVLFLCSAWAFIKAESRKILNFRVFAIAPVRARTATQVYKRVPALGLRSQSVLDARQGAQLMLAVNNADYGSVLAKTSYSGTTESV